MVNSLGVFLKTLRIEVFDNISQRKFAENMLQISKTKYNNIENNSLNGSLVRIIDELTEPLSKLLISNITAKSKLKGVTVKYFLSNFAGMQDCNYLMEHELNNVESMRYYLRFALFLASGNVSAQEQIEGEFHFHADRNYVVNKILNIVNPSEIMLLSHIEDYNIHIKFAKDNPNIKFDCYLEGLTSDLQQYIMGVLGNSDIKNMAFAEYDVKYLQYNVPNCVFIPYFMHHLREPQKIEAINNIYKNLPKNGYLIILDPFLDDNDVGHLKFNVRWDIWTQGVKSKKFFINLKDFTNDSIEFAEEFANTAEQQDIQMGESYIKNNDVQPVTLNWMRETVESIGFKTVLMKHTNTTSDAIFVLKK